MSVRRFYVFYLERLFRPWCNGNGLDTSVQSLGKLLTLPKVEIQPYDDDCMKYRTLRSVFKRCVGSVLDDDEIRLIHLKRCICFFLKYYCRRRL